MAGCAHRRDEYLSEAEPTPKWPCAVPDRQPVMTRDRSSSCIATQRAVTNLWREVPAYVTRRPIYLQYVASSSALPEKESCAARP
jgi:hypothetical protein